jgi:uncharacterized protein
VYDYKVSVPGARLAASYSPGERATMIALHGASEGTRHYELYEHLHQRLPTIGVGVVTFDRRGEGDSTGARSVDQFDRQADDAIAVSREVEGSRLAVWGFSQGGWVAPLLAARESRVSCLVGVAATGVSPAAQMIYGVAEHVRRQGYGESVVERVVALRQFYRDAMVGTVPVSHVDALLRDAAAEPWWTLAYLSPEVPHGPDRDAWLATMDYDPTPSFRALTVPALLVYGADDEWTPVPESASAWRAARGDGATVVVIANVGHDLHDRAGHLSPVYDDRMMSWLDDVL